MVREMERSGATALHGSFTQVPDLGARSGVSNDMGERKGRLPRPTTNERGVLERHEEYVVDARDGRGAPALRGSFAQTPVSEREAGSGTTWGALTRIPHLGALRWSLTQNPDLGARVGPGTARGALRGGCEEDSKKRSYGLSRVDDPDPPSRSEKRDLERHGLERRVRSAAYERNGKKRSYGLTRVDYQPDP